MLWKVYLVRCYDDSLYCRTTIDSNGREKMDSEIVCIVVISKVVGLKDTGSNQLANQPRHIEEFPRNMISLLCFRQGLLRQNGVPQKHCSADPTVKVSYPLRLETKIHIRINLQTNETKRSFWI